VLEALQGAQAYSTVPLEEPMGDDDEPVAKLGRLDAGFDRAEDRVEIGRGLEALSERERRIVALRFMYGLTQREIADRVGISQMHVSRLLRRSLEQMGDRVGAA
jgi:RNA polymerase sigma-B factor